MYIQLAFLLSGNSYKTHILPDYLTLSWNQFRARNWYGNISILHHLDILWIIHKLRHWLFSWRSSNLLFFSQFLKLRIIITLVISLAITHSCHLLIIWSLLRVFNENFTIVHLPFVSLDCRYGWQESTIFRWLRYITVVNHIYIRIVCWYLDRSHWLRFVIRIYRTTNKFALLELMLVVIRNFTHVCIEIR